MEYVNIDFQGKTYKVEYSQIPNKYEFEWFVLTVDGEDLEESDHLLCEENEAHFLEAIEEHFEEQEEYRRMIAWENSEYDKEFDPNNSFWYR